MISKLSIIAVVGIGYVRAEKFTDFYTSKMCEIAEADNPGVAFRMYEAFKDDVDRFSEYKNVRDRIIAEPESILQQAKDECARMSEVNDCIGEDSPGDNCRTVNIMAAMSIMGGYGCWGNFPQLMTAVTDVNSFEQMIQLGRGPPKDDLDSAARDLTQGYKCIMEEYILETGNTCAPWTSTYTVTSAPAADGQGLSEWTGQCESLADTEDSCTVKACMIETLFLARYIVWTFEHMSQYGMVFNNDNTYFHATSSWGTAVPYTGTSGRGAFVNNLANCPSTGTNTHVYCCGAYPFRRRVHSGASTDQCCDNTVYNDTTHKCCGDTYYLGGSDGVITPIADSC